MPATKEELYAISKAIYALLMKHVPPFEVGHDFETRLELLTPDSFSIDGRPAKKLHFAALILQSSYVGFYFMPIYMNPAMGKSIHPDLMKLLKGKSCFHVKTLDGSMKKHISAALTLGRKMVTEMGWIGSGDGKKSRTFSPVPKKQPTKRAAKVNAPRKKTARK